MGLLERSYAKLTNHIINMTDEPFKLYDDFTGEIITFFPNMRRFRWKDAKIVFPVNACYVFKSDMIDEIEWFKKNHRNVAVIYKKECGRDGIEVTKLVLAADSKDSVYYRK